jgi:cytochrome c biogenesis protein CcdA
MKRTRTEAWKNVATLVRFVFWYALGLATVFYVLPLAGRLFEAHYDAMSSLAKLLTLGGFLALVALWHRRNQRDQGE